MVAKEQVGHQIMAVVHLIKIILHKHECRKVSKCRAEDLSKLEFSIIDVVQKEAAEIELSPLVLTLFREGGDLAFERQIGRFLCNPIPRLEVELQSAVLGAVGGSLSLCLEDRLGFQIVLA